MSNDSVVVPREPTEAMIEAAEECGPIGCCNLTPNTAREVWFAMLSAAPQPADLRAELDEITNDVLPRAKSSGYLSVKARAQMQVEIADRVLALLQPSPVEQKDG